MKKLITMTIMVLVVSVVMAQSPEKFSYQAVVRNASNSLVVNAPVGVRVSILQGTASGNTVYVETHTAITNANGLLTLEIGGGSAQQGTFADIDWASGPYFIKTDIDPNGGTDYNIMSTQQLLSVPYALYAKSAANGFSGDYNDLSNRPQIPQIPQNVSAFTNDVGYITMDSVPSVPTNVSAFTNDAGYIISFTEQQILTISNDTIYLTGGSFVKLPAGFDGDYNNLTNKPNLFDGNYNSLTNRPDLAPIATSGAYNDLTGKPNLAPVATSGEYNDLSNRPQIPQIPQNVSAFNNDARYITMDSIPAIPIVPTNVSAFQNDAGYITQAAVPTNVSAFQNDAGYLTNFTEQQILSISNDTIYLTGGSFVKLPTAEGFSGSYNDLTDKPNLFSGNYNDLTGKPNLFSGDYNDLSNRPQIPQIPQNVSAFNNDAGYITMDSVPAIPTIPTNVSAFQNDAGYLTGYTETQNLANVTAHGNSAGNQQLKEVADPTDAQDAVTLRYLMGQLSAFSVAFQHQLDSLGRVISAQQAIIDEQQVFIDSVRNNGGGTTPVIPTTFTCGDNLVIGDYSYTTHQYGSQCWMTENLRSASGSYQFEWPGVLTSCPTGWHMPNNSDWSTLGANLPSSSMPFGDGEYWTSDLIPWADNGGNSFTLITPTIVQSTNVTLNGNGNACEVHAALQGYCSVSGSLISVRCVRDESGSTSQAPTVTTDSATSVTEVSATLNGTLSNPDNVTITGQGFEWKAIDGGSYTSVSAMGTTMSHSITGLTAGTSYTYRAFVTTDAGTTYGNDMTFTTTVIDTSANSLIMPDPCSVDTNTTWHPTLSPGSTICVGVDSVVLTLYNYQNGGIQWQYSTDSISWYNIPGAIEPQLTYKPEETQFVRTVVSYASCPPEYSPVKLLRMPPTANAGISRTANIGDTLFLRANAEDGATGEWQILQGEGGYLSHQFENHTFFSGTDTLYRLRWTLTNSCGSNTDDIEVRFVRTVVSDRVVMVDTTDIIFSDSAQMAQGYYEISFSDPNIVIGDSTILVSLINGGFMRMVDSWSMANDSTYAMQTSQASLFDILESGVIQFDAIPAAENADNTAQNEPTRQNVEYLDHIPTRNELRSNPNMTKSGTVYLMRMDVEDNNGNRVNMLRGNSRRGNSDDDRPKRMELECGDIDVAPDFEYKIDSAHFHLELNPVFAYDKDNRHLRFGLYGANFSVGADIVPKFTPVELEITPIEFTFINSPKIAFAVPVGPIVIPFTVDYGASVEVKGTIGASMEARYRFNAKATFTYGVNYWGRYNDFTIDKGFDGECDMGRVGEVNSEGSLELEASLSGYGNLRLAGVVGPRVKAGYKFKIKECAGGSNEAHIVGVQGKLTSELFLKLDLKGIKLVDKIIPKNWSKEWTLPIGKKHVFPDTVYRYSSDNINARTSSLVKVKVLGSGGKPTRNAAVLFRPQDGGTVYPSYAFTDKNGIAQTRWEPGQNSDVHQLYAYVYDCEQNPIKGAPVVFNAYEFEGCASSTLKLKYLVTGNTLTLQAEGGRPPYTYSTDGEHFVSLDSLPNLSALACHTLSVKDDNGCIRTLSYGHVDNMNCAWSDLGLDAEYSNDVLILQGIEGTPPYKYSLDGNEFITSNMFPSLSPGVYTAYVRDYAGCEYSREVTVEEDEIIDMTPIALQACPDAPTVTDYDGNIYNTVQIGEQCWMRENLRTTRYSNGTAIPLGGSNTSSTAPYYYDYTLSSIPLDQRGYHYNWPAAMHGASSSNANPSGVQGICPTGWHLPSDAEWTQLTNYVRSHSEYTCGGSSDNIAKALASTTGWNLATGMSSSISSCEVGSNLSANNSTGFSAVPSGSWNNGFSNAGYYAYFWSSTEYDATGVSLCRLGFNLANVNRNYFDKNGGFSVRCLRNGSGYATHAPTVTTDSVTSLAATSATLNGSITNPDSVPVTAQGFEWKAADSGSYTQVTATGSTMSYALTGLTPATTYTYRAFVTTGFGTTYGSEVNFTTTSNSETDGQPCQGTPTVTDIDGNVYNTMQIGAQCWMKENLRTTKKPDGSDIALNNGRYYPNNDANNVANYGYLYTWTVTMNGAASSDAIPSGVQGICPNGWHLPSDAEWTWMTYCVSCHSEYQCSYLGAIAKAMASTTGWSNSTIKCDVGYDQSSNNATGFGALPAGYFCKDNYDFGSDAFFWTSKKYAFGPYYRALRYNQSYVIREYFHYNNNRDYGRTCAYSVRCLRDYSGSAAQTPTVTTDNASFLAATSVTLNGSIVNPDYVPVTRQGFEWKANDGGNYTSVSAIWATATRTTMSYPLTGLNPATTYTYRAFITTANDTIYGNEVSFTTTSYSENRGQPCPESPTVTDNDGNIYNTVQIGNQCWMKENLRTTKKPDGSDMALGSDRFFPNDDTNNVAVYGYLYTWYAMMNRDYSNYQDIIPSGVQGICPTGWHVPSNAEWTLLTDYVSSQSEYQCNNDSSYIAKALAANTRWCALGTGVSLFPCGVYIDQNSNNATGFTALPAGSSPGDFGLYAYFWSSISDGYYKIGRCLSYLSPVVRNCNAEPTSRRSVRCLRD